MSFNTSAINTAITNAFKLVDTYGEHVASLQKLLRGADRDTVKGYVAPIAAKRYGAVYDPASDKWEDSGCAAKRYTNRLVADIVGTSSARKEEVDVPAEMLKVAAKLAKLAKQYKGAKALATKALAAAFTE